MEGDWEKLLRNEKGREGEKTLSGVLWFEVGGKKEKRKVRGGEEVAEVY